MKVRAIKPGFILGRRMRVGQIFDLPATSKLGKWMQPVDGAPDVPSAPVTAEPATFAELNQLEAERMDPKLIEAPADVNDKCPCGSNKKYKNCHGKT